ncbi:rhomboid family intramembrane serine protease [Glycomyces sp. TRM65418]|uniref:rhomboid family intramembrane serine protease n=1 Tax=Glycomyces sp. TRM65418 TaxID=2867006 RepID=UPI001CE5AD74|nr:rhomboid family intramembrane serine protease [Glycomyces sp. TRM65418]MCC3763261.1 rhomboid family intramembrane serine protease [Glycomyces sp. TRM65418]QZD57262.1 rhomboid family intramembrane serine protease [Glycomyces sp. TRM65418]
MTAPAAAPRPMHPLRRALTLWGAVIALMWLVLITDWILPAHLTHFGITPRTLEGLLPGLIAAPFLHAGAGHLVSNMVPLAVMGTVAALRDWGGMWAALTTALIASGLGVWLLSPAGSVTVGASGIAFGLFGYLLARGIFMRRIGDILIGVLLVLVYGSMIWGIFPTQPHISWQAHLFGFIGGAAAAFATAKARRSATA